MATDMTEHPWAKNLSNNIDPKKLKILRDSAKIVALKIALKKADEIIKIVWNSPFITQIVKQTIQKKFIAYGKARDRAMEYLKDKEDK